MDAFATPVLVATHELSSTDGGFGMLASTNTLNKHPCKEARKKTGSEP